MRASLDSVAERWFGRCLGGIKGGTRTHGIQQAHGSASRRRHTSGGRRRGRDPQLARPPRHPALIARRGGGRRRPAGHDRRQRVQRRHLPARRAVGAAPRPRQAPGLPGASRRQPRLRGGGEPRHGPQPALRRRARAQRRRGRPRRRPRPPGGGGRPARRRHRRAAAGTAGRRPAVLRAAHAHHAAGLGRRPARRRALGTPLTAGRVGGRPGGLRPGDRRRLGRGRRVPGQPGVPRRHRPPGRVVLPLLRGHGVLPPGPGRRVPGSAGAGRGHDALGRPLAGRPCPPGHAGTQPRAALRRRPRPGRRRRPTRRACWSTRRSAPGAGPRAGRPPGRCWPTACG